MRLNTKRFFSLIWFLIAAWLGIRYLLPVLMPFLLGAGMAVLAEPGVGFLSRRLRLPRTLAAGIGVGLVFAAVCVLITALFTFLFRELGVLAGILPDMEVTVRNGLEALRIWLSGMAEQAPVSVRALLCRNVNDLFSGGSALLDRFTRYALGLAGTILAALPDSALSAGTAVLSAFLISAKLPGIRSWVTAHISRQKLEAVAAALGRVKSTLLSWLTAQMKLSAITWALLCGGFLLLRIPYAPLWALAVSAVDAFPILGTGTVLIPWAIVRFLQQDSAAALALLGIYAVVALTRSMLEPKLVGQELGLDPLVTLIALYAGFRLWGIPGMLLMPVLAITALRLVPEEAS